MLVKTVTETDSYDFNNELQRTIDDLLEKRYECIEIKYSTCSLLYGDVLFSALVIAK